MRRHRSPCLVLPPRYLESCLQCFFVETLCPPGYSRPALPWLWESCSSIFRMRRNNRKIKQTRRINPTRQLYSPELRQRHSREIIRLCFIPAVSSSSAMQRRDGFFFCFTAWKSRLVIHRQNFSRMGTRSNDHKQSLTKNGKSMTGSIC